MNRRVPAWHDVRMPDAVFTVTVVDHPLVGERLAKLRDVNTPRSGFRRALAELGEMLVYEATRSLATVVTSVETPIATASSVALATQPVLVPVLRAGLGLLDGALRLLPDADAGFIGVARDEDSLVPVPYVSKLPEVIDHRPIIVLDPMLATGGSLEYTIQMLLERGATPPITAVCVLAAPEGIEHMRSTGLAIHIVTAAIDSHLNDKAYIVPGLGDAGDRQFGPAKASP
jgi:uracil phosphoribosyltransferase